MRIVPEGPNGPEGPRGHEAAADLGLYLKADRLAGLQAQVFALTWLSYGAYYLTRKNLSVVKSRLHDDLHMSTFALGGLDTLYLVCYALGQFASGALGDRLGPRRMLICGMLGSALMALLFGLSTWFAVFAFTMGANGFFQSTGWPNNVKLMGNWFSRSSRGKVMGLWATNYQVGGLCATALATFILVHHGWRMAFITPALLVAITATLLLLFLVERPQDRGLPPVDPGPAPGGPADAAVAAAASTAASDAAPGLRQILALPAIWALGAAYFGLKLIRYSLLFWLPFYLRQHLHYDEGTAGYLSTSFEAGGILGAISIGWISDRHFAGHRLRLAAPVIMALGGALLLYQACGHIGLMVNGAAMALVGFLLFGPDTLISGAAAQDIGGSRATGSVAGIINGIGSIGAVLQGVVTASVSERWGWNVLFEVFAGVAVVAGLTLLLLSRQKGR